jgi:uncharacterized RDD family membrane protein YckC
MADEALVKCGVCGTLVAPNLVVQLGGKTVCANCKSSVAREMTGARPVGMMRYAGFWIRFAALFLDALILMVPTMVVFVLLGFFSMTNEERGERGAGPQMMMNLGFYGAYLLYSVFFLGKFGATPGKMAVKIKVVRSDGMPIGYGRALGRWFANILSGLFCYLGYIMAAFDKEKRALHDRICDTRVIYK